jgi:hypothetical protein
VATREVSVSTPGVKRLLKEHGEYKLFEVVTAGRRSLYVVETTDGRWEFNTFYQSEAKFDRLLRRIRERGLA